MNNVINLLINELVWGDFSNPVFLSLFIFAIALVLVLTFVILTFVLLDRGDLSYVKSILNESNTLQIISIDVKNDKVMYFKRSDIANKQEMDLANFYAIFHENDVFKVKNWILSILKDKDSASPFLEADIVLKGANRNAFSLLKLIEYHPESNIIHIEMQALKYLNPTNEDKKRKKNKNNNNVKMTMGMMTSLINKSKSTKGYTFAIRFTYVNQAFEENEEERLMIIKLKDKLYPLVSASSRRHLVEINERELLVVDLSISDSVTAYKLAYSMSSIIHKTMLLNDYEKYLKLSIGIVENKSFFRDFTTIVKHAQEASLSAVKENREVCVYEKTVKPEISDERNNAEIDNLIKNNQLRYLFRPIVDVRGKKILGYLHIIKPYGCPFTNYNEIIHYAYSCGRAKDVFTLVAKNVIPRYADEVPKAKTPLFYPASILDFENIRNILPQITRFDKTKIVLVFEEQEISQNNSHLKELKNSLMTLKLLGVGLALSMMDKNLLLDPTFYTIFDYFVVGSSISGELKKSNVVRMAMRTLIESLLKYKKPIIATGLEGWQSVELMIKSGVNFVSSEAISPSNEMVVPIDKKKFDKLADFDR